MDHEPVGGPYARPDGPDPARLRRRLLDALRAGGQLTVPAVYAAMDAVPREAFMPPGTDPRDAYADRVIVLASDESGAALSTVSQPAIVALMLEQLDVRPGDRVLEIGTGSGYNTALLAELAGPTGRVTSIEVDADLVGGAAARLAELAPGGGAPLDLRRGDGWQGVPDGAPYDRVESTVGVDDVPPAWRTQLADGGLLVAPLWLCPGLELSVAFRRAGDLLTSESVTPCGFLQLRGPHGAEQRGHVVGLDLAAVGEALTLKDADVIADLLDTEAVDLGPAPHLTERRWWGFSLSDPRALLFVGRHGGNVAWGLFDSDGPTPAGTAGPGLALAYDGRLLSYGSPTAAYDLLTRLEAAPAVDPSRLEVTVYPSDHPVPPPPRGGATWRVTRTHHRYRVHWSPA
ncbi:rRNA adenine N-6-methyltransferase family protein [Yinghuangia seranimata]|uniref:rRNA adenine N-6-methyltransferase family protein n=1 Tax=Yinghuangia seranimata TaxID=408067 RepID=UPI00248C881E|nr:rRNA adenine N-6-methyltransferase family protein [Yinghuangia seranimata]MDI2124886.1 rRNA adenine N-6-methyltransferase family protein [Yinghuangia seranimata]